MEKGGAAPASVNRLRTALHAAFSRARKAKLWTGPNPVSEVETRRVPKRAYNTLRAEEVPIFLPCVDPEWRNLFAAALWTGLRKGELCGLLKSDVDLPGRTLFVGRSYDSDTTKGGHADAIPIAEPLVPYLEDAIRRSSSAYVFPAADGSMRSEDTTPQRVLRAALVRAGLVDGWEHLCRRCKANGAPHVERHPDSTLRRCDACGMKLWPRAIPRAMRFHDLRHATATLLLRAKVDAHRVQRILRHASINTTLGTYGHLDVEDLRDAINALPAGPAVPAIEPGIAPHGAPVVRSFSPAKAKAESAEISSTDPAFLPHDPAGIRTRVCAVRGHRPDH
jgi:integrase